MVSSFGWYIHKDGNGMEERRQISDASGRESGHRVVNVPFRIQELATIIYATVQLAVLLLPARGQAVVAHPTYCCTS